MARNIATKYYQSPKSKFIGLLIETDDVFGLKIISKIMNLTEIYMDIGFSGAVYLHISQIC